MTPLTGLPAPFWEALWLTARLAGATTLALLLLGMPLAWWLARRDTRLAAAVEALVGLPIVLPPTVIGFYLLVALSPQHGPGRWWNETFGQPLPFSFTGLVIGSVIYSLPFAVQPMQTAFRQVGRPLLDAALALGLSRRQAFLTVVLPLSRHGVLAGAALSFAHTIGEFGVVLMLGGNIPGQTRVASIALYDETQKLNYADAHAYAIVLLGLSFVLLLLITWLQRRRPPRNY